MSCPRARVPGLDDVAVLNLLVGFAADSRLLLRLSPVVVVVYLLLLIDGIVA